MRSVALHKYRRSPVRDVHAQTADLCGRRGEEKRLPSMRTEPDACSKPFAACEPRILIQKWMSLAKKRPAQALAFACARAAAGAGKRRPRFQRIASGRKRKLNNPP